MPNRVMRIPPTTPEPIMMRILLNGQLPDDTGEWR
jgi:hypothetical protein